MPRAKSTPVPDPFEAARTVYAALKPLDPDTRQRVMVSALSLLGMDAPATHTGASERAAAIPATTAAGVLPASHRPVSPVELIQQKEPTTNAQRLAVFAYHRERNEGMGRFSRADLKEYFGKARLVPPQNYDRDFVTAVELGYIYEDGAESYLTSKGLEAVERGFSGKSTPWGAKSTSKTKKKAKRSK